MQWFEFSVFYWRADVWIFFIEQILCHTSAKTTFCCSQKNIFLHVPLIITSVFLLKTKKETVLFSIGCEFLCGYIRANTASGPNGLKVKSAEEYIFMLLAKLNTVYSIVMKLKYQSRIYCFVSLSCYVWV